MLIGTFFALYVVGSAAQGTFVAWVFLVPLLRPVMSMPHWKTIKPKNASAARTMIGFVSSRI